MTGSKWFVLLYLKNLFLLMVAAGTVLGLFDTALAEVQHVAAMYSGWPDGLKVVMVLGLATIPLLLTLFESRLLNLSFEQLIKAMGQVKK